MFWKSELGIFSLHYNIGTVGKLRMGTSRPSEPIWERTLKQKLGRLKLKGTGCDRLGIDCTELKFEENSILSYIKNFHGLGISFNCFSLLTCRQLFYMSFLFHFEAPWSTLCKTHERKIFVSLTVKAKQPVEDYLSFTYRTCEAPRRIILFNETKSLADEIVRVLALVEWRQGDPELCKCPSGRSSIGTSRPSIC